MSADQAPILVVSTSARALAQSARRGGIRVIALDRFADRDTRDAALACRAIESTESGFDAQALRQAADELCPAGRCRGLVYGSGLEDRPRLLETLTAERPLYGNSAQTVRQLKDPATFFGLLRDLRIPHPETCLRRPHHEVGWLVKQVGASGGGHVQSAARVRARPFHRALYYQRHWPGRNVSLLFLADGVHCQAIGVSETWTTLQDPQAPHRYAGGVSDAAMGSRLVARLSDAARTLTAALGLKGFNGLDARVRGEEFVVLELNARPGATFELYEAKCTESFFALHLAACSGELPRVPLASPEAHAHAVVYAPRSLVIGDGTTWPAWCTDLPVSGSVIAAGAPLCMVHASGATAVAARRQVVNRHAKMTARFAHEDPAAGASITCPARFGTG